MPCLESGNFDVNSCIDGVMMADQRTRKNISVQNTFSKVGDYMIYLSVLVLSVVLVGLCTCRCKFSEDNMSWYWLVTGLFGLSRSMFMSPITTIRPSQVTVR